MGHAYAQPTFLLYNTLLILLLLLLIPCRVDYILTHPDVLSVTAFKLGVRVTPQGVSI